MTYTVINYTDVSDNILADCVQTSMHTLRHSVSGTDRVVLKYNGDSPAWVSTLGLTTYSHAEILDLIQTSDWKDTSEVGG